MILVWQVLPCVWRGNARLRGAMACVVSAYDGFEACDECISQGAFCCDVAGDGFYEGIVFEGTADTFKVDGFALAVAIGAKSGLGSEGKFLFGVFIEHAVEGNDRFFPGFHDADDVRGGDGRGVDAVPGLHGLPCPGPFQRVVVFMEVAEAGVDVFYVVNGAVDDLLKQFRDGVTGSDKSA